MAFQLNINGIDTWLLIYFTIVSVFDFIEWEEFEETKGVIRICKSKKNRQHNGQKIYTFLLGKSSM